MGLTEITFLRDTRGVWLDGDPCQVPGQGGHARSEFSWRASLLARYGRRYDAVSRDVWASMAYPEMTATWCFANALTLVTDLDPTLTYVEGWANYGRNPVGEREWFAHAWCSDGAGRVVDPTWREEELAGCLPREEWGYLGVAMDTQFVVALADRLHPDRGCRHWTFGVLTVDAKNEIEEELGHRPRG